MPDQSATAVLLGFWASQCGSCAPDSEDRTLAANTLATFATITVKIFGRASESKPFETLGYVSPSSDETLPNVGQPVLLCFSRNCEVGQTRQT
jgi:hypothetical protein